MSAARRFFFFFFASCAGSWLRLAVDQRARILLDEVVVGLNGRFTHTLEPMVEFAGMFLLLLLMSRCKTDIAHRLTTVI